jgi:hypothetical protein
MLMRLIANLAKFTIIVVGLELIIGQNVSVDLLLGHMYWLPISNLRELPDISSSIVNLFPVFLILPYLCLLAAGLFSLLEMD